MMDEVSKTNRQSKTSLIIALGALLIFAVAYVLVLKAYQNEGESRAANISDDTSNADENRIESYIKIVSADPVKGDIVVRIEFVPHGTFTTDDGVTLARDLQLYVSSATGKQIHEFHEGRRMSPVEAVIDMYEGEPMDYPFDKHKAELALYFEPGTMKEKTPSSTAAKSTDAAAGASEDEGEGEDSIPVTVNLYGSVNGLRIDATKARANADDFVDIDLAITRATTAKFFSGFIMSAMWLLTAAVIVLVVSVATGRRKIEVSMFSFLGALLFAFPALRNSQPGTPPIGTYSDFIAFFWVEVLIALSLLTILVLWLVRPTAK